jgi:hypothetical protein
VDEPITLTYYDVTLSGFSGSKAEYGPYAAEFAPVAAGRWTVSLPNLGASLEIQPDGYNLIEVDFTPYTAAEATAAAPTALPTVATPTLAPISSPQPPTATPTPEMQWVGAVLRHDKTYRGSVFASVAVRVNGRRDMPVTLTSGDTVLSCTTGTKPEYGEYACEFGGLSPGVYSAGIQGLEPSVPVTLDQGDFVLVEFRQEAPPPGPMVWLGRVARNSSQPWPANGVSSAIAVRVEGRRGQAVSLRGATGWEAFCHTGTKPEYGDYACEFGGLWPGVYTLSPVDIPAELRLYMDGIGFAEVVFESVVATPSAQPIDETPSPIAVVTRVIGAGAAPLRTPTAAPRASATASAPAGPTATQPRPVATASAPAGPTGTPSPTVTTTPTLARGWVGRVIQDEAGVGIGTIVVRTPGLGAQPVILRSGAWMLRGVTGSKPEYGENALEFGGLGPGDYSLELEGISGPTSVHLRPGGFLLVEFVYDALPTPTPTPQHGIWVGAVTRNTSGSAGSGAWSTLIVKIPSHEGLAVSIDSGGSFTTTCITGTKPEHGPGACEVGGLWPGTYRVTPPGLGPSVDVWLDGQGSATVEFWIQ